MLEFKVLREGSFRLKRKKSPCLEPQTDTKFVSVNPDNKTKGLKMVHG